MVRPKTIIFGFLADLGLKEYVPIMGLDTTSQHCKAERARGIPEAYVSKVNGLKVLAGSVFT
jgi:hypothetical protein